MLKQVMRGVVLTGVVVLGVCGGNLPVRAAVLTWTGATNTSWVNGSATNWSGGTYTNGVDDVIFDDTATGNTVVTSGTISPVSITFNNSTDNYTFSGTAISGSTGITKNGSGTVTMSNANTFTGKTNLNGGVLSISNSGLGANPGSPVADQLTFNGGTLRTTASLNLSPTGARNRGITVNAGGGTFDIATGTSTTLYGNITGLGGLVKTGAGTLLIGPPTNSPNTFAGGFHIQQGRLQVDTVSIGIPLQGAANSVSPGGFLVESGATLEFLTGGNQTWIDPVTLNGGTLQENTSTNNIFQGNITLTADSFINKGAANWNVTGAIQGGFGFTKGGIATLQLSGANTYSGKTTLAQGVMTVSAGSSLGTTSALTVQNLNGTGAVTLNLNNTSQTVGSLSGTVLAGGTANIAMSSNYILTVNQTTNGTYQGTLSGSNAQLRLSALSTADLILSSANTYTGATTINGGTLLATNTSGAQSSTGTGVVIVNNGGTLGGNGRIAGTINVNNGGTMEPGLNGAGILTTGAGVVFGAGATFRAEIGGATPGLHDQLNATGVVSLNGILDVNVINGFSADPNDMIEIISAGSLTGEFSNVANGERISTGSGSFQVFYFADSVVLTNFQVPEPSTCILLAAGSLGLVWSSRRLRANRA